VDNSIKQNFNIVKFLLWNSIFNSDNDLTFVIIYNIYCITITSKYINNSQIFHKTIKFLTKIINTQLVINIHSHLLWPTLHSQGRLDTLCGLKRILKCGQGRSFFCLECELWNVFFEFFGEFELEKLRKTRSEF
jgi:hypothetical protein